jgi:hypothetical protein
LAKEITCVVPDGKDPDTQIEMVGGPGWRKTESYAIAEIEHFRRSFFVEVDATPVSVTVDEREGRKYLRTDPAQGTENQLLSLPPCPPR